MQPSPASSLCWYVQSCLFCTLCFEAVTSVVLENWILQKVLLKNSLLYFWSVLHPPPWMKEVSVNICCSLKSFDGCYFGHVARKDIFPVTYSEDNGSDKWINTGWHKENSDPEPIWLTIHMIVIRWQANDLIFGLLIEMDYLGFSGQRFRPQQPIVLP